MKPLLDDADHFWKRDHLVEQYLGGPYAKALPHTPFDYSVVMIERWRLVNSEVERLFDIQVDPGQSRDLALDHPGVVADLRAHYGTFWKRVRPRLTPVRIDIGNPSDNPTVLCSQDWYLENGNPPWNFNEIRRLPRTTGPWMIEVQKAGRYRFTLRQFPKEANKPVLGVQAELEIAGKVLQQAIEPGSMGVVMETDLPAGPTQLVPRIFDETGKAGGAYFTEVEALMDLHPRP